MKVIVWTSTIYRLYKEIGGVGGIAVQMSFWAQTFLDMNWRVYSISNTERVDINGITFLKMPQFRFVGIIVELLYSFFYIATIRPDVIVFRGASRSIFFLSLLSKLYSVKLVFFGASDTDFKKGKELLAHEYDRLLYREGLKNISYFVVQNKIQYDLLVSRYKNKEVIIIPNIWLQQEKFDTTYRDCILWVANFYDFKRPQWFLQLAKDFPQYKFLMVGGRGKDSYLFESMKKEAGTLTNLEFTGQKSFQEVNRLFCRAKYYICTSEIEGFPNTFLQSWSNSIPIITSFDPGSLVSKKGLGLVITTYDDLKTAISLIESDEKLYFKLQNNIEKYFVEFHDNKSGYEKLVDAFSLCK